MHTSGGRRGARGGAEQCRAARPSCGPRSRAAADWCPPVVCSSPEGVAAGPAPAQESSLASSSRPAVTAATQPELIAPDGRGESGQPGG
jgi:hypothetical protein